MAGFEGEELTGRDWIGVVAGVFALATGFFSWRHVSGPQLPD